MQHVSVARVGAEIKRRLAELPRKRYLIAAAILVGLMALGEFMGGPEALHALCNQTYAILQADGAAAFFLDGKWQPGIAFESRDFLAMSQIGSEALRAELLAAASAALERSRDQ